MSEYEVPEGMHKAAVAAWSKATPETPIGNCLREIELAIVRWIAENPRVPTEEQLQSIADEHKRGKCYPEKINLYIEGFQRRMFLKPEPEVPGVLRDLVWDKTPGAWPSPVGEHTRIHNEQILEAYRRGKEKG